MHIKTKNLRTRYNVVAKSYYVPAKEKSTLIHAKNYAPVLYIQSDCDTASDRDRYVSELMKYIRIDSYGTCVNNARLDDRYIHYFAYNFLYSIARLIIIDG